MQMFNKQELHEISKENGFVRDTYEKVLRLVNVLDFIQSDAQLTNQVLLKGGTAINLAMDNSPRLSTDIDLDFSMPCDKELMKEQRLDITKKIDLFMSANGYVRNEKSKHHHALDSFVYEYTNCGGVKDNLKIEINYMLRAHLLNPDERTYKVPGSDNEHTIKTVAKEEIYGTKIAALKNRTLARDLYDMVRFVEHQLPTADTNKIKTCAVFYAAISSKTTPKNLSLDVVDKITIRDVTTSLYPMLRSRTHFDLDTAKETVREFANKYLQISDDEKKFLRLFSHGKYKPELLFREQTPDTIKQHPMAKWKCKQMELHIEK